MDRFSQTKLVNPESVLEHHGWVAFTAFALAHKLNGFSEGFDLYEILARAIVHDVDEVGTGDIPRPTKYANDTVHSEINMIATAYVHNLTEELGLPELKTHWANAKRDRSGAVIALCDGLSVLFKVWQEAVLFGNLSIIDHAGPVREMLERKFTKLNEYIRNARAYEFLITFRAEAMELCDEIEALEYKGEY